VPVSDRNAKANFEEVDPGSILERLAMIPIQTWNYKGQNPSVRHIGPMAQDIAATFGVGEDDKHINGVDADGIAFAAIQGLYRLLKEKEAEIEIQRQHFAMIEKQLNYQTQHNADLKARLERLETLMKSTRSPASADRK
jgi:hypothetical protein